MYICMHELVCVCVYMRSATFDAYITQKYVYIMIVHSGMAIKSC